MKTTLKNKPKRQQWRRFCDENQLTTKMLKLGNPNESLSEIAFRIIHDFDEPPTCFCGEYLKFTKNTYSTFCSRSCASKKSTNQVSKSNREKIKIQNVGLTSKQKLRNRGNVPFLDFVKITGLLEFVESFRCDNDDTLQEIIFRILNDVTTHPKCVCNEKLGFNKFTNEYYKTCSYKCSGKNSVNAVKTTCLKRYGVENHVQLGLHRNFKFKNYVLPSGKIIKIQGYENFLLDALLLEHDETEILTNRADMPELWYFSGGKKHRYFPDAYVPCINTIFEVKSQYTSTRNAEINKLKFQSVVNNQFAFVLKIFTKTGKEIKTTAVTSNNENNRGHLET